MPEFRTLSDRVRASLENFQTKLTRFVRRFQRKWSSRPFRSYGLTLLVAFAAALFLRLLHISILEYSPVSDMYVYLQAAQIAFGAKSSYLPELTSRTSLTPTLIFPPGYPFFLAMVSRLAGGLESIKTPLLAQSLLDALAVLALAGATRRVYGTWAAILAAFGYALYHLAIANSGLPLTETLTTVLLIATLFFFAAFCRKPTFVRSFACALCFTASVYTRSNMLALMAGLAAYGLYAVFRFARLHSVSFTRTLLPLVLMLILPPLLLLPWSIRNTRIVGKPTFIATNMGMNLAMGHNPNATGTYMSLNNLPPEDLERMKPDLSDQKLRSYAQDFIRSYPDYEIFHLLPQRLEWLFWGEQKFWPWQTHGGEGNYFEDLFGPRVCIPLLPYSWVLVLGLMGMLFRGRRPFVFFIPVAYICVIGPYLVFFGSPRFRSVGDPLLIIAAAGLLSRISIRGLSKPKLLRRAGVLWAGAALLCTALQVLRFGSANLLKSSDFVRPTEQLIKAVTDSLTVEAPGANRSQPTAIPLGQLKLTPGTASHLLFAFDYQVTPLGPVDRGDTFDLQLSYRSESGKTLPAPAFQSRLLSGGVELNRFLPGGGRFSRAIRVPALARTADLTLLVNFPARVTIEDLGAYGPVWIEESETRQP